MLNPISYLRGWLDGKGIEHEDTDREYFYLRIYNTHLMTDGGEFSVSWGYTTQSEKHGLTMGYPDKVEGVYLSALDYGVDPRPYTVDEIKELVNGQV